MINWIGCIAIILTLIFVLTSAYLKHNKRERKERVCQNCRKKEYDEWFEVVCMNKRSKHYKHMRDDYFSCEHWRGVTR